jgi:hypothetical protein
MAFDSVLFRYYKSQLQREVQTIRELRVQLESKDRVLQRSTMTAASVRQSSAIAPTSMHAAAVRSQTAASTSSHPPRSSTVSSRD